MNQSNGSASDVIEAVRARNLLELLDLTGNDEALIDALAELGLATSHSSFGSMLDRLEAAGLVGTSIVRVGPITARVATITMAGDDVRLGREERDWIAGPKARVP